MSDGNQIKALREAKGLSQEQLAELSKVNQQTISRIETGETKYSRAIPRLMKILDEAAGKAVTIPAATIPDALPHGPNTLPVFTSARGGPGEMLLSYDPIEYIAKPAPLYGVKNGYAMYIVGDSMEPAFKQGDLALINPNVPARVGDDVLIFRKLNGEFAAIIKSLVREYPTVWTVQQYNPPKQFELEKSEWPECHVIVGKYSRR